MRTREEILNIFVERVKDLMIDKNINSIYELAKKTSIPRTSLNCWFLKIRTPSLEYIVQLALFFDVSTDYLLGLEN